jgi:penicillin-insensitive murein DD-endopeptidase
MRPSRNRNWGHPELVSFIERLAISAAVHTGWPGILVGDMTQPRGGPLPFGHASHQIGLDVHIWFQPKPKGSMTAAEADTTPMTSVVAAKGDQLDPQTWQPADKALIRLAAEQPQVERICALPDRLSVGSKRPFRQAMVATRHSTSGFHHRTCFRRCNG